MQKSGKGEREREKKQDLITHYKQRDTGTREYFMQNGWMTKKEKERRRGE